MTGEAGELASLLGSPKDRGRWWIADNKSCAKWFRWFEAQPHCTTISLDGTRIYLAEGRRRDRHRNAGRAMAGAGRELRYRLSPSLAADRQRSGSSALGSRQQPHSSPPPPIRHRSARPRPIRQAHAPAAAAAQAATPPVREQLLPTCRSAASAPAGQSSGPAAYRPSREACTCRRRAEICPGSSSAAARPPVQPAIPRREEARVLQGFRRRSLTDVLYVRSGPSQDHTSVGMIPPTGRGIVITGRCRDDWCPIRHRNVAGWVNRYYLAQDSAR